MHETKIKYIPELKITEVDIINESDREKLKSFKTHITKSVFELENDPNIRTKKFTGRIAHLSSDHQKKLSAGIFRLRIYKFFLNLINEREAKLNHLEKEERRNNSEREDKAIIAELRKHIPEELFLEIVKKVKSSCVEQ